MAHSCKCPAGPGVTCPLTDAQCYARRDAAKAKATMHAPDPRLRTKRDHRKHLALLRATGRTYADA